MDSLKLGGVNNLLAPFSIPPGPGGWGRGALELEVLKGDPPILFLTFFPGYFFTWTWRHRVSELRGGVLLRQVGLEGHCPSCSFLYSSSIPQAQLGCRPLHHPASSCQVHLSPCVSVTPAREGMGGRWRPLVLGLFLSSAASWGLDSK